MKKIILSPTEMNLLLLIYDTSYLSSQIDKELGIIRSKYLSGIPEDHEGIVLNVQSYEEIEFLGSIAEFYADFGIENRQKMLDLRENAELLLSQSKIFLAVDKEQFEILGLVALENGMFTSISSIFFDHRNGTKIFPTDGGDFEVEQYELDQFIETLKMESENKEDVYSPETIEKIKKWYKHLTRENI